MKEIGYYRIHGGESWSAKTPEINPDGSFHLYSNDIERGLDVYRFERPSQALAKSGAWMGAKQAAAYFAGLPQARVTRSNALVCMLAQ